MVNAAMIKDSLLKTAIFGTVSLGICHAQASSIFLDPPPGWNGMNINVYVEAGYQWQDPMDALHKVSTSSSGSTFIPTGLHPAGAGITVMDSAMHLPDTGDVKDFSSVSGSTTYTIGATPSTFDTIDFNVTSTTSAMTAFADFGPPFGVQPAASYTRFQVDILTQAPLPGTSGYAFALPAMPTLTDPSQESVTSIYSTTIGGVPTFGSGFGYNVPLNLVNPSDSFHYTFIYEVLTPHGVDPTFSHSLTAVVVPELGSSSLLGLSSLLLLSRRRK